MIKRITYLDLLRCIAISAVVLLHTVSGVITQYGEQMASSQLQIYSMIKFLCSFCVPLFVMISGALLLDPDKKISIHDLLLKYVRRLVIALLLFGTAYAELELIVVHHGFFWKDISQAILNMLSGNSWAHMWYLYMMIGLYLILPILKGFVAYYGKKGLEYGLILLFIFQVILPMISQYTGIQIGVTLPMAGIYVVYMLFGYYLSKYLKQSLNITIISIALIILSILAIIYISLKDPAYPVLYDSPVIIILSCSIFAFSTQFKREFKLCRALNPYVFGIYLIHTFFLNLFYKGLHVTPLMCGGYVLIPVVMIVTMLLSIAFVWGMRKVPFMKKYVL